MGVKASSHWNLSAPYAALTPEDALGTRLDALAIYLSPDLPSVLPDLWCPSTGLMAADDDEDPGTKGEKPHHHRSPVGVYDQFPVELLLIGPHWALDPTRRTGYSTATTPTSSAVGSRPPQEGGLCLCWEVTIDQPLVSASRATSPSGDSTDAGWGAH